MARNYDQRTSDDADINQQLALGAIPFQDYGSAPVSLNYLPPVEPTTDEEFNQAATIERGNPLIAQPITQPVAPLVQSGAAPSQGGAGTGTLTDIGNRYLGQKQQALQGERQARLAAINAIPNSMGGSLEAYEKPDLTPDMKKLDESAKRLEDLARLRDERANQLKADVEKYKTDLNDAKIDPNRYLANMSTGNKILAGIGLMLSGLTPSTMNASMSLINNAIQNDVQSQRDLLGKKETLYSNALKLYGDEVTAATVAETKLMEMAINKMEIKYKLATIPAMKAKIGMALQNAYAAQAEQYAKLSLLADNATSFEAINKMQAPKTGEGRLTQETFSKLPKEVQQRSIIGLGGAAPSPAKRDEVEKLFNGTMGLNRTINELVKLSERSNMWQSNKLVYESDARAIADLLAELGQYQVIRSTFGVDKNLNLREIDAAKSVLKSPIKWTERKDKIIKQLRTLQGFTNNKFKEKAQTSGFTEFPEEIEIGSQYNPVQLAK